jgi:hypothetical protein
VADGILLDVSPIARDAKLNYPTFISAALWNGVEIHGSKGILQALLEYMNIIKIDIQYERFGTEKYCIKPLLAKRGWPPAAFPHLLYMSVTLYRLASGLVLIVLTYGDEELDFRVSRSGANSFFVM